MNENIIASKIQILIEAAWQCGFYSGAIEHGNMILSEKERYRRMLKDSLDKRNVAKKDLLDTVRKSGNIPYDRLDTGQEVYRL